jgi:hypothetical protein
MDTHAVGNLNLLVVSLLIARLFLEATDRTEWPYGIKVGLSPTTLLNGEVQRYNEEDRSTRIVEEG